MIDVKGIRSARGHADSSDPLNLHDAAEQDNKKVLGWFGGLVAVGLYIRSFLWSDAEALVPVEETSPSDTKEGDATAPRKSALKLVDKEPTPPETEPDDPASDAEAPAASPFPALIGPFDALYFAPPQDLMFATTLSGGSANLSLPPFERLDQIVPGLSEDALVGTISVSLSSESEMSLQLDTGAETEGPDGGEDETDEDQTRGPNKPPVSSGPVHLGNVGSGLAVGFALTYFLSHTTDPEGEVLSLSMVDTTSGTILQKPDAWLYLADIDDLGEVAIEYSISDGEIEIPQTAYLNVVENVFHGTDGDDLLVGTRGRDAINGREGDDNLAGLGGKDTIDGGGGDDNIAGGDGNDSLTGGEGDDIISGGNGDDLISGGAGNDRLYGEAGQDEIHGDAGDDEIDGGGGDDLLFGGDGDDQLSGGDGHDMIAGNAGDDLILGEAGNDEVAGDAGDDEIDGGDGDDVMSGGEGNDRVRGGTGDDVVSGDAGRDTLMGDTGDDIVFAGSGDDTAFGDDGDDLIFGGDGDDLLDGGDGDDIVSGEDGQDVLTGGDGDDILRGGLDEDTVEGGAGDDIVIADDDGVSDSYDGGDGDDRLDYSDAAASVIFSLGAGTVSGETIGDDSFEDFERFVGTKSDDTFHACGGEGELTGNGGADLYTFVQGDTVDIIRSIYQITDYDSDDEIWIGMGASRSQIRKAQNSIEDRIEDGLEDYAEGIGADEPRLSYHFDWTETYRRTVIEVDFDRDDVIDLQVLLDGEHVLAIEHA